MSDLPILTDVTAFERLLDAGTALIYKHSSRCAFSSWAHDEVVRFAGVRPEVAIGMVDVIVDRALSLEIAERLGVTHESPQAILLRHGDVVWQGSHGALKAAALHQALQAVPTD